MFVKGWILLASVTLSLWAGETPLQYPKNYKKATMWEPLPRYQKVADPYRWLEDLDSQATEHWVEKPKQGDLLGIYPLLASGTPIKKGLRKFGITNGIQHPLKGGGRYFYFKK